jgi:DNA modification methylase
MIYPRLALMKELLSEKGSIYVHIDWHVGAYVKILMDDIFGKENFVNEIVWKSGVVKGAKTTSNSYGRMIDSLFFCNSQAPLNHKSNKDVRILGRELIYMALASEM